MINQRRIILSEKIWKNSFIVLVVISIGITLTAVSAPFAMRIPVDPGADLEVIGIDDPDPVNRGCVVGVCTDDNEFWG